MFVTSDGVRFTVQTVARNLQVPWSLAFAPDGRIFVTERPGRVRIVQGTTLVSQPALTLSDVNAEGEGGLLGLTLHPDFNRTRWVYLVYTARRADGSPVNRLVRYREVDNTLAEGAVLLDDIPASGIHNGSRVRFGPDGKLYMTMGDAADPSVAQDLAALNGRIFRLNDDGTTPRDNPLASPVYSYGHRNPQGIDWHPSSGELWETEHGATGNDEVNRIVAGRNYGWPEIEGGESRAGMETPVRFYSPAIAPSGASFYRGQSLPGLSKRLLLCHAARSASASRATRRQFPSRRRRGAPARESLRQAPRCRVGPGRRHLSRHEQSRWSRRSGRRGRPYPAAGAGPVTLARPPAVPIR